MSEKINLTKILKDNIDNPNNRDLQTLIERYATPHDILDAMKEACRQTLELATKNAECEDGAIIDLGFEIIAASVNKQSILDTINQIE